MTQGERARDIWARGEKKGERGKRRKGRKKRKGKKKKMCAECE